jgi:hypothetical protein
MNQEIEYFFAETKRIFRFLETDFGYKLIFADMKHENYYPDSVAVVQYLGGKVGIEIYWYFASAVIDVAFVEIMKVGEYPEKKRFFGRSSVGAAAIGLHTYLEYRQKDSLYLLKKMSSRKMSDIKKRGSIIQNNLSTVLENIAGILLEQAKDILLGDTSIFPLIQEYEEESIKKRYLE